MFFILLIQFKKKKKRISFFYFSSTSALVLATNRIYCSSYFVGFFNNKNLSNQQYKPFQFESFNNIIWMNISNKESSSSQTPVVAQNTPFSFSFVLFFFPWSPTVSFAFVAQIRWRVQERPTLSLFPLLSPALPVVSLRKGRIFRSGLMLFCPEWEWECGNPYWERPGGGSSSAKTAMPERTVPFFSSIGGGRHNDAIFVLYGFGGGGLGSPWGRNRSFALVSPKTGGSGRCVLAVLSRIDSFFIICFSLRIWIYRASKFSFLLNILILCFPPFLSYYLVPLVDCSNLTSYNCLLVSF